MGISVAQSSKPPNVLPPLRFLPPDRGHAVMGSSLYRTSDRTWEEFVNILPKVAGFLGGSGFLPQKKLTG